MKLFLCSHFSSVGSLIKEEIGNKKVAFIPTASLREGYTGYVGSARKLFKKLGAIVTEIDISTEAYSTTVSYTHLTLPTKLRTKDRGNPSKKSLSTDR